MATLSVPTNTPTKTGALTGCASDDATGTIHTGGRIDRAWENTLADKQTLIDGVSATLEWKNTQAGSASPSQVVAGLPPNGGTQYVGWAHTDQVYDASAPAISAITESHDRLGRDNQIIEWETDDPATSFIEYGLTIGYGTTQNNDPVMSFNHLMLLENLTQDTEYNYKITSVNQNGNSTSSANRTFTTAALLGQDYIVNGDFADGDTGWTDSPPGIGWTITGNEVVAVAAAPGERIKQLYLDTLGEGMPPGDYAVEYEIVAISAGSVQVRLTGDSTESYNVYSTTGVKTQNITTTDTKIGFNLQPVSAFTGTVDNFSVVAI